MDFILNELSIQEAVETKSQAQEVMVNFLRTCKKTKDAGFKRLRYNGNLKQIPLTNEYTIEAWLRDTEIDSDLKDRFRDIVTDSPFIDRKSIMIAQKYENICFVYNYIAEGLGITYLYNTLVVSFLTSEEWNQTSFYVNILNNDTNEIIDKVLIDRHASTPEHVEIHKRIFENNNKHGWCGKGNQPKESKMYCCTQDEAIFLLNTAIKHVGKTDTLCNYDPKNQRFIIFPKHLPNTYHGYHYENDNPDLNHPKKGIHFSLQQELKQRMTNIYHLLN